MGRGAGISPAFAALTGKRGGPSQHPVYTVKKKLAVFPSPSGMSLTKLSLAAVVAAVATVAAVAAIAGQARYKKGQWSNGGPR